MLERYELKYMIPESLIEPISRFASVYCSLDKHSGKTTDGFYIVNSLYLDSPNYLFLKKRLNRCENRFNMRIRSYGKDSPLPYFFELKQKQVNIVRKYRSTVRDKAWHKMFEFENSQLRNPLQDPNSSHLDIFLWAAYTYNVSPKVLTQYKRKAFVSDVDDYARLTFDKDLKFQFEEQFKLKPDNEKMNSYDKSTLFDPECNIILELKCYSSLVPLWMLDLIRHFDLRRRSFSKYMNSVSEVITAIKYDDSYRNSSFALEQK